MVNNIKQDGIGGGVFSTSINDSINIPVSWG